MPRETMPARRLVGRCLWVCVQRVGAFPGSVAHNFLVGIRIVVMNVHRCAAQGRWMSADR
jgi:hypothetical protein